jgi:hypothetical protein
MNEPPRRQERQVYKTEGLLRAGSEPWLVSFLAFLAVHSVTVSKETRPPASSRHAISAAGRQGCACFAPA